MFLLNKVEKAVNFLRYPFVNIWVVMPVNLPMFFDNQRDIDGYLRQDVAFVGHVYVFLDDFFGNTVKSLGVCVMSNFFRIHYSRIAFSEIFLCSIHSF